MNHILPILVTLAVLLIFPAFIFFLLVRAIRNAGTRWWGIVILLAILTCYCTTLVCVAGLIVGGNATGTAALEQRYCEAFCEALTQTETLPEAFARMDAESTAEDYLVREPDKNLRFRYVWLLAGCFLFAGANLMMFGPGRRERRHPADCVVMILAALYVFLNGIWQISWGNGYAYREMAYRRMLTEWHTTIPPDAIHVSNAELAAWLSGEVEAKRVSLRNLSVRLCTISAEVEGQPGLSKLPKPDETEKPEEEAAPADAGTSSGIAIIGGADGPTAVFVSTELMKKLDSVPTENGGNPDLQVESPAAEENAAD